MLSKTLPIFGTAVLPDVRFGDDVVDYDEDCGVWIAMLGDDAYEVEPVGERPARWWSVAIYDTSREYGGPEEGGWYYTAGTLTHYERARIFDDWREANTYVGELKAWLATQDSSLMIRCETEKMPARHFPTNRPSYR